MPRLPSFLKTSWAGNCSFSSHSSTYGLISASMNFFIVRRISSCSCVNFMRCLLGACDAELHRAHAAGVRVLANRKSEAEDVARIARVYDAVVEHRGTRDESALLPLEVVDDAFLQIRDLR